MQPDAQATKRAPAREQKPSSRPTSRLGAPRPRPPAPLPVRTRAARRPAPKPRTAPEQPTRPKIPQPFLLCVHGVAMRPFPLPPLLHLPIDERHQWHLKPAGHRFSSLPQRPLPIKSARALAPPYTSSPSPSSLYLSSTPRSRARPCRRSPPHHPWRLAGACAHRPRPQSEPLYRSLLAKIVEPSLLVDVDPSA